MPDSWIFFDSAPEFLEPPFPPNFSGKKGQVTSVWRSTVRVTWKDESPNHMDSFKKLAGAVILAALSDAQNGSQEAQVWLLEDGLSFRFWCGVYGIEPNLAHCCLKKAIRTAPVTRRRRRELVIQTLTEHPELSNREIGRRLKVNYATVRRVRMTSSIVGAQTIHISEPT